MNHLIPAVDEDLVEVRNARSGTSVVIVCEHASAHIPQEFGTLGLSDQDRLSHVVWDPGALAVASRMAGNLDAVLISARTSRLVYDCNRPPHAPDAIPERSELVDVPGNSGLSADEKTARATRFYEPFRAAVSDFLSNVPEPVLVTVHSFTPTYFGKARDVEIGILHDSDSRLADAMLANATGHTNYEVRRNEPYGPSDGVTHTLKVHALPSGRLNVMLEIRNDLIADDHSQQSMADMLSAWVAKALETLEVTACRA